MSGVSSTKFHMVKFDTYGLVQRRAEDLQENRCFTTNEKFHLDSV